MPARTTRKVQKAAAPSKNASKLEAEQRKERRLIRKMMEQERAMKWLLVAVVVLLVFLFLIAGYATDWLQGINKDPVVQAPTTGLDTSTLPSAIDTATGTSGGGATSTGTTSRSNTSNGTDKETSTSSTTNNTSTTTNPGTSTTDEGLLTRLYNDSSVGNDIASVSNNAAQLGIPKVCHTELLIQVCDFTTGTSTVTTKDLLGSGLVTSVTKNF